MKTKKTPESDDELLRRYRAMEKFEFERGRPFDLERQLCTAIARRDNDIAEKTAARQLMWSHAVHYAIQLGIAFYICIRWNDLDIKVFLLLLAAFLYRFIAYSAEKIQYLQARTILWLAMVNPTAKDRFFRSKHCYAWDPIGRRVFDLLRKEPST